MTSPRRVLFLLGTIGILAATAPGCGRREPAVARVFSTDGTVESKRVETWTVAAPGGELWIGDWLRTGPRSRAELSMAGGHVHLGENARVHLLRRQDAARHQTAPELAVDLGSAEIEETSEELVISTAAGAARVDRGTRLRVQATGDAIAFEVQVGRAVLLRPNGEEEVRGGQAIRVRIDIGDAAVERYDVVVRQAIVERSPPANPAPVATPEPIIADAGLAITSGGSAQAGMAKLGEPVVNAAVPGRAGGTVVDDDVDVADVTLRAGETAVLHDTRATLGVRLRLDTLCPAGGRIEFGQGKRTRTLSGSRAVVLRVGPTVQRYRLRCDGDAPTKAPRATGALSLKRDSGNVPLSLHPPANTVEADGRRYSVLFQSRLPILTFAWSAAPAAARALTLFIESPGATRTFPAATPTKTLASGALAEGTYTWWYATADDVRSPRTTVTILFDNTAGTAQFFRAQAGPGATPQSVSIDGVTLPGAEVSVADRPLETNGAGRFQAVLEPVEGDSAVAVRLEHPRTGVHYYVRRRESP